MICPGLVNIFSNNAAQKVLVFSLFCREHLKIDAWQTKDNIVEHLCPVHQHEHAWEHLRSVNEVPLGISFSDYVSSDANAVSTEVLDDGDILWLEGSVEKVATEGAGEDAEDIEASVPTPGEVMDFVYLFWMLAGMHADMVNALDALQLMRNLCGHCLQSTRKQRSPTT